MTQIVKNAVDEYKTKVFGQGENIHNQFTRKLHMGCSMGIITKEELDQINQIIHDIRVEEMHKDIERISNIFNF